MAISETKLRDIFRHLERGDGAGFFAHVADDVDWTVMGSHPLAGHYLSKTAFIAGTFAKLAKVLPGGAQLTVENVFLSGSDAVVELRSNAVALNGLKFDNHYCWVLRLDGDIIVRVRAYLDSALVARLFAENPVE